MLRVPLHSKIFIFLSNFYFFKPKTCVVLLSLSTFIATTLSSRRNSCSHKNNRLNMEGAIFNHPVTYLDAATAKEIDDRLMSSERPSFSIDQLMELAGLSVANAAHDYIISSSTLQPSIGCQSVLIICGPGNNGGDGLVAARHLFHFGYTPVIIYPKPSKGLLFDNLVQQCRDLDIPVLSDFAEYDKSKDEFILIIDALFGFSFKGPVREPFVSIIKLLSSSSIPVLSVDIPSGWDVNDGDIYNTGFNPSCVISLTLPKKCMVDYAGHHYVGGRFVPPKLASDMGLVMPNYGKNPNQVN